MFLLVTDHSTKFWSLGVILHFIFLKGNPHDHLVTFIQIIKWHCLLSLYKGFVFIYSDYIMTIYMKLPN